MYARRTFVFGFLLSSLVLGACQGLDLETQAPTQFNLTGTWRLDPTISDASPDARKLGRNRDPYRGPGAQPRGSFGSSLAFVAHDFPVLESQQMVIEQNADSMGVRYDNGRYRDISWGERERGPWKIHAGWQEGALMVVSRTKDQRVEETMTLEEGGRVLVVAVSASAGDEDLKLTRVFTR